MINNIRHLIDFEKLNALLEDFYKSTGFVTAILDLEGNVLSKSGWRQICTEFHRVNPDTSKKCTISDTELANKMGEGEKYHFYKCHNGLIDVAVPIIIDGEHVANLFFGQFFFEEPNISVFKKQAEKYGFNENKYLDALNKVPIVSEEKVKAAIDFLLAMTLLISDMAIQKAEQVELNKQIGESKNIFESVFESANVGKSITSTKGEINVNQAFCDMLGYSREELRNKKWQDLTPKDEIPTIQAFLNPLLNGKANSAKFEKRYICKNGTYIWADVSVSLHCDDNGKPLHFITTIIDITERKQAEQLVQEKNEEIASQNEELNQANKELIEAKQEAVESEEKYRAMYNNAPLSYQSLDENGCFIDINPMWLKTLGYERDEVIGKWYGDFLHPDFVEHFRINFPAFKKRGYVSDVQFKLRKKDNTYIYVSFEGCVGYTPEGKFRQTYCVFKDITEQKALEKAVIKAKEKAEESENQIKKILETAMDGFWMVDMHGNIIDANDAYCKMSGYTREELITMHISDIEAIEDANDVRARIKKVITEGKDRFETKHRTKSGEEFDVEISLKFQPENNGFFVLFIRNITERKKAEQAIKESEEKFKAIVENGSVLLTLTDAQGRIEFASPQCEKVIGWKEEDIIGVSLPDFIHPDDKQRVSAEREKASSLRPIKDFEYRIIDKKNKIRWVSHSATLIKKGDSFSILSTITNITERKQTEEALSENEEKTRYILKHNPNAIAVFDNKMNILIVSDRFLEDYDMADKNIVGENLYNVFPELPEKWRDAHRKALQGNILTNNDDFFIRPDGSITYTRWECRPWYRSDNSIGGMIAYTEVITERKLSEIALQKSEERFNLAMSASNDGLFDWNLITNEIYYSPGWKKMLGYEDHELPNDFSVWETTTDPEDVKKSWELQQKLIAKQVDRFVMEFKMKHKDGHWVDILSRAEAFFDEEGKAIRMVGTHTDISERMRLKDALEKRILALTQPMDNSDGIGFEELFNIADIQRLQDEFSLATNVASIITNPDGTPITKPSNFSRLCSEIIRKTEIGCANCFKSDAALGQPNSEGPTVRPCLSGGLWDAGAAIHVGNRHIANWMIGQVRDEEQSEEKIREYAALIGANEDDAVAAFRELPSMSRQQFEQVAKTLFTLANIFSNTAYQNVQQARFITERKQAEEKEKELLKKFELISLHLPGVIYQFRLRTDGTFHFPYASHGIYEIYGVHPKDVEHDAANAFKAIHPDDFEQVSTSINRSAQTLTPWHDIYRVNLPSGKTIWVEGNSSPQKLEDGSIIWHGFIHDITIRKIVEKELKAAKEKAERNEQELLKAQRIAHVGSWYLNVETNEVIWTEELYKMYGFDPTQPVPPFTEHMKLFTLESWEILSKSLAKTRETGMPYELELKTIRKDKSKGWMWVRGEAVLDESNKIIGLWGAAQDITERKQAEDELRKLSQAVEQSPASVVIYQPKRHHRICEP
jgi:PAS domain S-box-containing protein